MTDEAVSSIRKSTSVRARVQSLVRTVIEPKRASGWRALLLMSAFVLCALLASLLLRLALVPSASSRQLFAFAALFFSGGICVLAYVLPSRVAAIVSRAGLVALVASIVWVNLVSGA
jgi:hypothetical protein